MGKLYLLLSSDAEFRSNYQYPIFLETSPFPKVDIIMGQSSHTTILTIHVSRCFSRRAVVLNFSLSIILKLMYRRAIVRSFFKLSKYISPFKLEYEYSS
jgi:hypothetical protein